ncbi:MAG: diadenylate cyclase CdaA [Erysipelotrichaceae bacterium]
MIDYNLNLTIQTIMEVTKVILDISIVWLVLYYAIKIVRNNTRTIQIFKGIVLIVIIDSVAKIFGLGTVGEISSMFMNWGFLAVIIIFQPEIRSVLERLGKSSVFSKISNLLGTEREQLVDQLVQATMALSQNQTGALITIEQSQSLQDYIKTGVALNSSVSAELLTSIFVTSTPLHDGACIIQGDKLSCASAYFPPTNVEVSNKYGARHRAAIGISEITDSITIVVSEETGEVSIAQRGTLTKVNRSELRDYLMRTICNAETEVHQEIDATSIFVLEDASVELEVEKPVESTKIKDKLSIKRQPSTADKPKKSLFGFKRKEKEDKPSKEVVENVVEKKEEVIVEETPALDMKLPQNKRKVKKIDFNASTESEQEKVVVETSDEVVEKVKKPRNRKEDKKEEVVVVESSEVGKTGEVQESPIDISQRIDIITPDDDIASQFALIDSDDEVLEIRSGTSSENTSPSKQDEKGVNNDVK